ncbi:MAG: sulfotransferase family 2 domain-containing protein [Candidatus Marithrix sp.]
MFISHKYKVIFIHIQRTGGNSIQKIFEQFDPDLVAKVHIKPNQNRLKHCFITDIKDVIENDIFQDYLKFTIIRNPYDRIVSWYFKIKHETIDEPLAQDAKMLGDKVMLEVNKHANNFDEFLALPDNHDLFNRFHINQLDYITKNNTVLVDKILSFENLASDFNDLANEIDFAGKLLHSNKSKRNSDYQNYYNDMTKNMIFQRFKKDFDYFGYKF